LIPVKDLRRAEPIRRIIEGIVMPEGWARQPSDPVMRMLVSWLWQHADAVRRCLWRRHPPTSAHRARRRSCRSDGQMSHGQDSSSSACFLGHPEGTPATVRRLRDSLLSQNSLYFADSGTCDTRRIVRDSLDGRVRQKGRHFMNRPSCPILGQ
jgi:hypothetical protein